MAWSLSKTAQWFAILMLQTINGVVRDWAVKWNLHQLNTTIKFTDYYFYFHTEEIIPWNKGQYCNNLSNYLICQSKV